MNESDNQRSETNEPQEERRVSAPPAGTVPPASAASASGGSVPPGRGASVPPTKGASVPPAAGEAEAVTFVEGDSQDPAQSALSDLKAQLEKAQADAQKYRDQLLRTAADFDNFRKRARKDVEDAQRKGLENALVEILPVSDNLERAVQASGSASDIQSILEGVRMVLKFFGDALGRLGVERVPAVGTSFDPSLHEAVAHVESTDAPPGTIVAELMPGYRLGTKLVRAAMVSVARAPAVSAAPQAPDATGPSHEEGPGTH